MGVHKDDYLFLMNDQPLKKFGSQGQQKSFLISLRLSQFDYLSKMMGTKPILLLDDVFEKLDDNRIQKLTDLLSNDGRFGQVFITDARTERSTQFVKSTTAGKKGKMDKTKTFKIMDGNLVNDEKG
jgi:DNA replication and repair protein RecF